MIKQLTFTIVALLALTAPAGAQFALDWRTLPPKEFDHEFAGKLIITRANREELDRLCAGALPSGRKIACAAVPAPGATECRIYIGDDAVLAGAGSSFEETVRHERGHCNGWSEAHERARSMREVLASEGKPVPTLKVCTLMVFGVPTFIPVLCVS